MTIHAAPETRSEAEWNRHVTHLQETVCYLLKRNEELRNAIGNAGSTLGYGRAIIPNDEQAFASETAALRLQPISWS